MLMLALAVRQNSQNMNKLIGLGVLLLVALPAMCSAACSYTANGWTYDLSSLTKTRGVYSGTGDGVTYAMDVCGIVHDGGICEQNSCTICQTNEMVGCHSKSMPNSWAMIDNSNPHLGAKQVFVGRANACQVAGRWVPARIEIQFTCSTAPTPDQFQVTPLNPDDPNCLLTFQLPSPAACPHPANSGLSGGSIFIAVVLCSAVIYVVGGLIYGTVVQKREGIEAFPHINFWRTLPGLVKDGVRFTFFERCGTAKKSGYQTVTEGSAGAAT